MQYRKDKHEKELSVLGFGCMRFTKKAEILILTRQKRRSWRLTAPA